MTWIYLPEQSKNYHSSREEEGDYSLDNISKNGLPSATLNENHTQLTSSKQELQTDGLTTPQSGMTLPHSTGDPGVEQWILSLLGSLANHSQYPGNENLQQTIETDGLTPFVLLEKFNPHTSSSKTLEDFCPQWILPQANLFHTSEPYSEIWPSAGMMQDGGCYRLPKWAHRIDGIDYGLGLYDAGQWPTPKASDGQWGTPRTSGRPVELVTHLGTAVKFWLTPSVMQIGTSPGRRSKRTAYRQSVGRQDTPGSLLEQVQTKKFWPTITVNGNYNRKGLSATSGDGLSTAVNKFPTPTGDDANNITRDSGAFQSLTRIVRYTWAPPTSRDFRSTQASEETHKKNSRPLSEQVGRMEKNTGALNPDWVEWLMGWPIGWTSLEPLPPEQFYNWLDQTISGNWWTEEPPIPRVITPQAVKNRGARLKALGNGQVPLQAAVAWTLLNKKMN